MARKPRTAAPAAPKPAKPKREVVVKHESDIAPLFALHKINGEPSRRVFVPVNQEQRDELIELGAARELSEVEQLAFGGTPVPAPAADDSAADDAATSDEAQASDGADTAGAADGDAAADAQDDAAASDASASDDSFA